jgi:hypothetical protein
MQQVNAAWTCGVDMQQGHAGLHFKDMQHGHSSLKRACKTEIQQGKEARTCSLSVHIENAE